MVSDILQKTVKVLFELQIK